MKPQLNNTQIGALLILVFNVLSAGQSLVVGNLVQGVPAVVGVFWTFLLAAVFFTLTQTRTLPQLVKKCRNHFADFIASNICSTLSWVGYFVALKYLEPAIEAAVSFAIGPLMTVLLWKKMRPSQKILRAEIIAACGTFASISFMIASVLTGKTAFTVGVPEGIVGLICCFISGSAIVGNTLYSKRLNEFGFSSNEILASRFWLLLGVCLLLWPSGYPFIPPVYFFDMILLSIFGVILPVWVIQAGIERSEPITVSLILATLPGVIYLFQFMDKRLNPSVLSFLGIVCCIAFTLWGTLSRSRASKKAHA